MVIFRICLLLAAALAFSPKVMGAERGFERSRFASCPPICREGVAALERMEEVRELLRKTQRSGPIAICAAVPPGDFEAMWDGDRRMILINPRYCRDKGSILVSLLFELHNAASNETFMEIIAKAERGQINKRQFVEAVERMEHSNGLKVRHLLALGRKRGLFPPSACMPIPENFEEYYRLQRQHGHSQWIAASYDRYVRAAHWRRG